MEVGEFMEQLAYDGGSQTKNGKGVWVTMKGGGKLGMCLFAIPYSMMIPDKDGQPYVIVEWRDKRYIKYRMTKGMHNSCTWGKRKEDGTKMFKSSRTFGGGGGAVSQGGRTKGSKQYFCKACQKQVSIERDNANNAYCCDCGTKMFG